MISVGSLKKVDRNVLSAKSADDQLKVLEELEDTVRRNLSSVYALGYSLWVIRDTELYKLRSQYASFDDYVRGFFHKSVDWGRVIADAGKFFYDLNDAYGVKAFDMPNDYSALIPIMHQRIPRNEAMKTYNEILDEVKSSNDAEVRAKRGAAITRNVISSHKKVKELRKKYLPKSVHKRSAKTLADIESAIKRLSTDIARHIELHGKNKTTILDHLQSLVVELREP